MEKVRGVDISTWLDKPQKAKTLLNTLDFKEYTSYSMWTLVWVGTPYWLVEGPNVERMEVSRDLWPYSFVLSALDTIDAVQAHLYF